jgi:hypothetical protein
MKNEKCNMKNGTLICYFSLNEKICNEIRPCSSGLGIRIFWF